MSETAATPEIETPEPKRLAARLACWAKARPWRAAALAGGGGFLTVGFLAASNSNGALPLLIAPFGASCVLVFGAPASPLAQPRHVIGGHLLAAIIGLAAAWALGYGPLGTAIGVGAAIAAMMLTDTLHPPAGANPIIVSLIHADWSFLATPVLAGATVIVGMGIAYHRVISSAKYPHW
jgi:CBS-domain-containing membrane protein